eukprot:31493-Pelagococcus_subviridis.AAC.2
MDGSGSGSGGVSKRGCGYLGIIALFISFVNSFVRSLFRYFVRSFVVTQDTRPTSSRSRARSPCRGLSLKTPPVPARAHRPAARNVFSRSALVSTTSTSNAVHAVEHDGGGARARSPVPLAQRCGADRSGDTNGDVDGDGSGFVASPRRFPPPGPSTFPVASAASASAAGSAVPGLTGLGAGS